MKQIYIVILLISVSHAQPILQEYYYDGLDRQYYLYIPEYIEPGSPLVFVFHGYTGSAQGIMEYSGMNDVADEHGFAVCYPQGTIDDFGSTFFNVGYSFHWNQTVDDVGFTIALAQYLQSEHNLSEVNTFSTGMSNGGDMSYLLACEASTYFKAIAPIAGIMMGWLYDSCDPERPIPVLEVHGTNDNVSWWDGDLEDVDGWGPYVGVDAAIEFWKDVNECSTTTLDTLPDINQSDGSTVVTEIYTDCINDNEVWLYKVLDGGHDWPGAWGNMDINSSELGWEFFDLFSMDYFIGDVDHDGQLNVIDILLITDDVIASEEFDFMLDHNGDGVIDLNDIYSVIAVVLGF